MLHYMAPKRNAWAIFSNFKLAHPYCNYIFFWKKNMLFTTCEKTPLFSSFHGIFKSKPWCLSATVHSRFVQLSLKGMVLYTTSIIMMAEYKFTLNDRSVAIGSWGINRRQTVSLIDSLDKPLWFQLPQSRHKTSFWIQEYKVIIMAVIWVRGTLRWCLFTSTLTASIITVDTCSQEHLGWQLQGAWTPIYWSKESIRAKGWLGLFPWAQIALYPPSKITSHAEMRANYAGSASIGVFQGPIENHLNWIQSSTKPN